MRFTMAKTQKQLTDILEAVRGEDLSTLRALDEKLHLLLAQKRAEDRPRNGNIAAREETATQCSGVKIDPDLLALVGIHPENPVEEDKVLIRDSILRRLTD
jgi:hypothetical protein